MPGVASSGFRWHNVLEVDSGSITGEELRMTRADLSGSPLDSLFDGTDEYDEPDVAALARRRRRRRIALIAILLVLVLIGAAAFAYVRLSLGAPLPAATVSVTQPTATPAKPVLLVMPPFGSSAVSVTGAEDFAGTVGTDGILAASGTSDPLPIASISKLITAMMILDAKPLADGEAGPTITFSEADSDLYDDYYVLGATIQPMKTGSTMSERDALEMLLVVSASNYAESVSTWAFGSQANFLRATRSWLDEHGLVNTRISEPTGLDARNVSTTSDLIALGRLALADPTVTGIVRQPFLDVPGFAPTSNNNDLLGEKGVNGIKTGTLDEAGSCLLFSAELRLESIEPITMVGVVLGGPSREGVDQAVTALIESFERGFHDVPVVRRGTVVGEYATAWGEESAVVATRDASVFTWSDSPIVASMSAPATITTGRAGDEVASVDYVTENDEVTVPLALESAIAEPDDWWRLTHPDLLLWP